MIRCEEWNKKPLAFLYRACTAYTVPCSHIHTPFGLEVRFSIQLKCMWTTWIQLAAHAWSTTRPSRRLNDRFRCLLVKSLKNYWLFIKNQLFSYFARLSHRRSFIRNRRTSDRMAFAFDAASFRTLHFALKNMISHFEKLNRIMMNGRMLAMSTCVGFVYTTLMCIEEFYNRWFD